MNAKQKTKRRIYTPRRAAQLHFAAVFNEASNAIGSAFLERVDADRKVAEHLAAAFRRQLAETFRDAVVAPVVRRLIAGGVPGPLRYVGTGKSSMGWRGLPQNIAKPAFTAPVPRRAPGKPR